MQANMLGGDLPTYLSSDGALWILVQLNIWGMILLSSFLEVDFSTINLH